ncbi:hypothetical protein E2C01_052113 [Portunus trituberculatus]|uniref:Uncharacterized protein n=1 Tax=Portunus trituberculatus TaxID=210409 RepID=A0A5B7GM59_PORTR|nr:hypothetical protein [Portunus trituberculatus]
MAPRSRRGERSQLIDLARHITIAVLGGRRSAERQPSVACADRTPALHRRNVGNEQQCFVSIHYGCDWCYHFCEAAMHGRLSRLINRHHSVMQLFHHSGHAQLKLHCHKDKSFHITKLFT